LQPCGWSAIDGVEGKARAVDIAKCLVQDIDTPEMLAQAEKHYGHASHGLSGS